MGRFARSWQLMKASVDVLMHERKLLVFPLVSGICLLLIMASFALPMAWSVGLFASSPQIRIDPDAIHLGWYAILFVFYVVEYGIAFFFNTALVCAALEHLDGGHPSVRGSLAKAWSKWPQILGFALISATVGVFLRAIEERLGLIGRFVIGLVGMAWSVVTFLVAPILAATDAGPVDAVKDSANMLKRTWGENLVGAVGLHAFTFVAVLAWMLSVAVLVVAAVAAKSVALFVLTVVLAMVGIVLISLVQSALRGVYSAALYRYATTGEVGGRFDTELMEQAFRRRK
ncbi:MAG TPA: DUF6159 family protein [Oleiagrimonas sp.]|nr:DUF6159 family protein [Oleiagrimonas sp.]